MALPLPGTIRHDFGRPRLRATLKRLQYLIAARNEQSLHEFGKRFSGDWRLQAQIILAKVTLKSGCVAFEGHMLASYAVEGGNPQIRVGGSNESITQAHHRFVSLLQLLSERPIGASVLDRQETARPIPNWHRSV